MSSEDALFNFPFTPYQIQRKFMTKLYATIQQKRLGIFESPTGTGKSLSICCSAIQWLKDNEQKIRDNLINEIDTIKQDLKQSTDTNDWLEAEYDRIKKNQTLVALQNNLEIIKKREEHFKEMQLRVYQCKANLNKIDRYLNNVDKNIEVDKENVDSKNIDDEDLIVGEYDKIGDDSDGEEVVPAENNDFTKIYISSRTHSQLSQFVGEIKRTSFGTNTRVLTLASRQHYCINSDVARLKNVNLINERCLDMQKSKTKSTLVSEEGKVLKKTKTKTCTSCPYYNQTNIQKLKERLLVDIMDMEDLVKCGKQLKACPYYASRMALDDAEVVLISHAGMVSSGARSGISLKLKDNVIIFDEAHGLTAALENAHSAPISSKQLSAVKIFLQFYINKYKSKFSSKSLLLLNQVLFIVGKLLGIVKSLEEGKDSVHTIEQFVLKAEIDHLNIRPLVEFCRTARLAPKLHGFSMRYNQQDLSEQSKNKPADNKTSFKQFLNNIAKKKSEEVMEEQKVDVKQPSEISPEISPGSSLYAVLEFLERLCERSEDGRVLIKATGLLYILLNPNQHFIPLVEASRSVIVAGGTMEPVSEFQELLTNETESDRINIVKCDHVVPPENVLAICLTKGPSNINLNFTYQNRGCKDLLNEVGGILRNVCSIVPGGVVCFLPSYTYEQTLYEHLSKTNIINTICKRKAIFREPKSASEVDQILQKFALAVKNKSSDQNGALLLSVVGGKLSEGLNFSDDLGRCVMVVGMPYPNIKSPELQEKINYIQRKTPGGGNVYYENLCMKAVNQCIGRAVRHANDYACVLLVDARYSRPQTIEALPSFVQKSLLPNCTFGQSIGSIAKFFNRHKNKK